MSEQPPGKGPAKSTITIPGTKIKLPKWAVLVIGGGVAAALFFLKPGKAEEDLSLSEGLLAEQKAQEEKDALSSDLEDVASKLPEIPDIPIPDMSIPDMGIPPLSDIPMTDVAGEPPYFPGEAVWPGAESTDEKSTTTPGAVTSNPYTPFPTQPGAPKKANLPGLASDVRSATGILSQTPASATSAPYTPFATAPSRAKAPPRLEDIAPPGAPSGTSSLSQAVVNFTQGMQQKLAEVQHKLAQAQQKKAGALAASSAAVAAAKEAKAILQARKNQAAVVAALAQAQQVKIKVAQAKAKLAAQAQPKKKK